MSFRRLTTLGPGQYTIAGENLAPFPVTQEDSGWALFVSTIGGNAHCFETATTFSGTALSSTVRCVSPVSGEDVESDFAWSYRADSLEYPQHDEYSPNFAYARVQSDGSLVAEESLNPLDLRDDDVRVERNAVGDYTVTFIDLNPLEGSLEPALSPYNVLVQKTCSGDEDGGAEPGGCYRAVCTPEAWTPGDFTTLRHDRRGALLPRPTERRGTRGFESGSETKASRRRAVGRAACATDGRTSRPRSRRPAAERRPSSSERASTRPRKPHFPGLRRRGVPLRARRLRRELRRTDHAVLHRRGRARGLVARAGRRVLQRGPRRLRCPPTDVRSTGRSRVRPRHRRLFRFVRESRRFALDDEHDVLSGRADSRAFATLPAVTLAQRLLLAIAAVTIATTATAGFFFRQAWRGTEERRFRDDYREVVKRLGPQLADGARDVETLVGFLCENDTTVDGALVALRNGTLEDRRLQLRLLVPKLAQAHRLDELVLLTHSGDVLGALDPALVGQRDAALAARVARGGKATLREAPSLAFEYACQHRDTAGARARRGWACTRRATSMRCSSASANLPA